MRLIAENTTLNVTIFQSGDQDFNWGALKNAGFLEAIETLPFDCTLFHDVDLLLPADMTQYQCSRIPQQLCSG